MRDGGKGGEGGIGELIGTVMGGGIGGEGRGGEEGKGGVRDEGSHKEGIQRDFLLLFLYW